MDLSLIALMTGAVLAVLLVVLAAIAVFVLRPAVRRALAQRAESIPPDAAPDTDTRDEGTGRP